MQDFSVHISTGYFPQTFLYLLLLSVFKLKMKCNSIWAVLFVSLLFFCACNSNPKNGSVPLKRAESAFTKVNGVRFFEVKRRFRNGLSFNKDGFQHVPTWVLEFQAPDTMLAYSPEKKGMEAFYLHYDHGQVYNFAREFFRAIAIEKDSLVLQRLQVNGKVIAGDDDVRSDVYCTFYTKDYIENKLHTTIGELQNTTKADTAFIQKLTERSNRDPGNPATAFAATAPVVFTPKSKFVTVEKLVTIDETNHRSASYDYMYPQYKIAILRSYKKFFHSFSLIVDAKGKMYVNRVDNVMPEDVPPRKKLLQGITDLYLKNLFTITPGQTLGIPHSSEITIYLTGVSGN